MERRKNVSFVSGSVLVAKAGSSSSLAKRPKPLFVASNACPVVLRTSMKVDVENEWEIMKKLREEGFLHTFATQDVPNAEYMDHKHGTTNAHVVVSGEMEIIMENRVYSVKVGDRVDVPANTLHAARVGPKGCRYIVGQ
mmetsp:Transcript_22952/g.37766  ORF Transcript_22952/g.37766 Transcript_22952/m.37766 type:complete len:139 (+) Transcript_22952:163-579(+)|eukprot:CAMPEP_0184643650 /NCGR_PEP_ID=MMETSP0308-20130426/478_1 /TAXON_ID=38269 /ORGANISM="Gloeochaete witrockiana, Strain SAG 46.84" /LENGTH=138 /DNA_ID=CAMNT_0027071715 /DNA_START=1409 /DNA_END=1825 /DNA_ORIENTATION=-